MKLKALLISLIVSVVACDNIEPAQDSETIAARVSALGIGEPNPDPEPKDIDIMGLKSTPLTAVPVFTANIYPPNPGSPVQAADVEAGEQVLLNRTAYLYAYVSGVVVPHVYTHTGAYAFGTFTTTSYVNTTDYVQVSDALSGDTLIVLFQSLAGASSIGAPGTGEVDFTSVQDFGGGNYVVNPIASSRTIEDSGVAIGNSAHLNMIASIGVTADGIARVYMRGKVSGAGITCNVTGPIVFIVVHIRSTPPVTP